MDIVINEKPGFFNLSIYGKKKLAEKKSLDVFYYVESKDSKGHIEYHRLDIIPEEDYDYLIVTRNLGATIRDFPDVKGLFFFPNDISRDDGDLINLLREHGSNMISGPCSKLKVVTIPDDVDWTLTCGGDGTEWIAEKHRTWN